MAQQILKHIVSGQERKVTIEAVIKGGRRPGFAAAQPVEAEVEFKANCIPSTGGYVSGRKELTQASLPEIAGVRGQASHYGSPLDQQDSSNSATLTRI